MNRQAPRSATVLYSIAATCGVLGALLRVRGRAVEGIWLHPSTYGSALIAGPSRTSAWQVWSPQVPEERLGLYLLIAAVVLAVVARLVSVWRD